MVQKLLELELKNMQDGQKMSDLLVELGDVYCDQGDLDKATQTYARALGVSQGKNTEASGCLEDVQVRRVDLARSRAALSCVRLTTRRRLPARRGTSCARLASRAGLLRKQWRGCSAQAYAADPANREAAALFENLLVEGQRTDAILEQQRASSSRRSRIPPSKPKLRFASGRAG